MSFKLIVISPPASIKNENKLVLGLFTRGLKLFHLRKPGYSKLQLRNYLMQIPAKFHKKIVIHSHYALVIEFNLKGVHLTEKTRRKNLPAFFVSKKHSLSASFHSIEAIYRSKRKYNYAFLSPVFDSISKNNYKSNFKEAELSGLTKKNKNVVALGGINPYTIKKIKQLDFLGAATLGYIWESQNPIKAFELLNSKIK